MRFAWAEAIAEGFEAIRSGWSATERVIQAMPAAWSGSGSAVIGSLHHSGR
jgi:hypothetical protein